MRKPIHNDITFAEERKRLRSNSTAAEAILWSHIKNKKLNGRKFRRQHSIQNFIVDFYCPAEKLIIELDGHFHFTVGGQVHDENRDSELKRLGFRIIHFENILVREHLETVLDLIRDQFAAPC